MGGRRCRSSGPRTGCRQSGRGRGTPNPARAVASTIASQTRWLGTAIVTTSSTTSSRERSTIPTDTIAHRGAPRSPLAYASNRGAAVVPSDAPSSRPRCSGPGATTICTRCTLRPSRPVRQQDRQRGQAQREVEHVLRDTKRDGERAVQQEAGREPARASQREVQHADGPREALRGCGTPGKPTCVDANQARAQMQDAMEPVVCQSPLQQLRDHGVDRDEDEDHRSGLAVPSVHRSHHPPAFPRGLPSGPRDPLGNHPPRAD